jgi:hypothetical protein
LRNSGFKGRKWLFKAMKKSQQDMKLDSRFFWIMDLTGVERSVFASKPAHARADMVIAAQFCEWDTPGHFDIRKVIHKLALQPDTCQPAYRKLQLNSLEIAEFDRKNVPILFHDIRADPLFHVLRDYKYLIEIDALRRPPRKKASVTNGYAGGDSALLVQHTQLNSIQKAKNK